MEDISHIAKDVLQTGKLTNEHVSELAKLTAKQIYAQGYQAGEAADKIEVWNAAIEAAANELIQKKLVDQGWNYHWPSMAQEAADNIRKLKK